MSTMNSIDILTMNGEKSTTLELPALFTATPKQEVLHQAVVAYLANARQSNAHTKLRGEVSGGGRKPWKQKGTGRARHGSSRSPLWIGGGITFGPRSDRNYTKQLPTRMKRIALAMALSDKVQSGKLIVLDSISVIEAKTKFAAALVARFAPQASSALLVLDKRNENLLRSVRNLPFVSVMIATDMNTYDVLNFDTIIISKAGLEAAAATFKLEK